MVGCMYQFIFAPPVSITHPSFAKINVQRYGPVWTLITQDYLSIMVSSVSLSEWAFSQGVITISKHCNHLKEDVIEALQCIKCAICHDLLFREAGPVMTQNLMVEWMKLSVLTSICYISCCLLFVGLNHQSYWCHIIPVRSLHKVIYNIFCNLCTWAVAWAKAEPKPAIADSFGMDLRILKAWTVESQARTSLHATQPSTILHVNPIPLMHCMA